ncbi:MAG: DUF4147 domain-containing protein, partial [Candidatus Woesearchaeota archaeon]
ILGNDISFGDNDVYVIGAGKSSGYMAEALNDVIGDYITKGIINTDSGHTDMGNIRVQKSSVSPTKQNINNTARILTLAKKVKQEDIVIFLISEGSSSMLMHPSGEITQEDLIKAEKLIRESGIPEEDADKIRKHISSVKGGRLAEAFGCRFFTLVISDKEDGDLSEVGGSPCDSDISTFDDATKITKDNKLKFPKTVLNHLDAGKKGKIEDTPKVMPTNSKIFVIGSIFDILSSAKKHSAERRIKAQEFKLTGGIKESARALSDALMKERSRPCMYIGYGKNVDDDDWKGSRNSQFIVETVNLLGDLKKPWLLLSFDTGSTAPDGDLRGAMVDGSQFEKVSSFEEDDTDSSDKFLNKYASMIRSDGMTVDLSDIVIAFLGTGWNNKRNNSKRNNSKRNKNVKRRQR